MPLLRNSLGWLVLALACLCFALPAGARPKQDAANHSAASTAGITPTPVPPKKHSPYRSSAKSTQSDEYYHLSWGIDHLHVKLTASGNLVRFSYRVTDVEQAKAISDKKASPQLIDPQRGVMLLVPEMDKIGKLRQTGVPVAGREYWMVFSNKGEVVKAGDRVDVVIGVFHADGLVVE